MISDINTKIKNIDDMLLDLDKLENYIKKIELSPCEVPQGLEKRITRQIKNENSKILKKESKVNIRKFNFKDILKVAACTVFAIAMWQFVLSKPIAYAGNSEVQVKRNVIYDKIDEKMKNINEFFMNPLFSKGEK